MKALHLAWIFPVAVALGWIAGMRLREREVSRPVADHERPSAGEAAPAAAAPDPRIDGLLERRADLERKLRVALAAVPRQKTPDERRAMALAMLEGFRGSGGKAEDWYEATRHFPELGPDLAGIFIKELRTESPFVQSQVLDCVFACGGPEVSALLFNAASIAETMPPATETEPATAADDTGTLGFLENAIYNRLNMEKIPVTGELLDLAVRLTQANDSRRTLGVTILGGSPTPGTRELLKKIALTDREGETRSAAFVALGACGDASTLAWLEALPTQEDPTVAEYAAVAVARLKRKVGR